MKYWLHRVAYEQNVSVPLLEKGYLSIGFSDFCEKEFFTDVVKKQDKGSIDTYMMEAWGELSRNRHTLCRFLVEMKKGDWVLVPGRKTFSVYEICDDEPLLASDNAITLPETDWYGKKIGRDRKWKLITVDGKSEYVDIGFVRSVKLLYKDISRSDYADAALTSRMKIRNTNADISDIAKSVKTAVDGFKKNRPINLKEDILKKTIDIWNELIAKELNADKYEKLVKWYFQRAGASEVIIPPKYAEDKQGDVDVRVTFESIKTIIYVQVKFHQNETSDWAVTQIKDFATSKENMSDGYNRQYWVISSADSFSEEAHNLAQESNVLLVDGRQFVQMLLEVGIETLEVFDKA